MASSDEGTAPIEQLPDEILLRVFKYLRSEDLKTVALVSRKWSDLVAHSIAIMRELPLSFSYSHGSWSKIQKRTEGFKRKYHTMVVKGCRSWNAHASKVFHKFGPELRRLEIGSFSVGDKTNMWNQILETCGRLEFLNITNCYISKDEPQNLPKSLNHLKTVVLDNSSCAFLERIIKSSQLTSLKFNEDGYEDDYSLADALSRQCNLQELALRYIQNIENVAPSKLMSMNFPLMKNLSFRSIFHVLFGSIENMMILMNKFKDTLEELEVAETRFDQSFYEVIFKKLKKLKVLRIDVGDAPQEDAFYQNVGQNQSIQQLIINKSSTEKHLTAMKGIIGNLPNVTELSLESKIIPNDLLAFVSNNLLKLESLSLFTISGRMLQFSRIAGLKELKIKKLKRMEPNDWESVVAAFPSLETLSIEQIDKPESASDLMFDIITKGFRNLKHIKLGIGFIPIKRIFNQLKANCENLTTVEIPESVFKGKTSSKKKILRDFKRDGLSLFTYPEDQTENIFKKNLGLWGDDLLNLNTYELHHVSDDDDEDFDSDLEYGN